MRFFGLGKKEVEPEPVYMNSLKQKCHDYLISEARKGRKYFKSKHAAEEMVKSGIHITSYSVGTFIGDFSRENNGMKIEKNSVSKSIIWKVTLTEQ